MGLTEYPCTSWTPKNLPSHRFLRMAFQVTRLSMGWGRRVTNNNSPDIRAAGALGGPLLLLCLAWAPFLMAGKRFYITAPCYPPRSKAYDYFPHVTWHPCLLQHRGSDVLNKLNWLSILNFLCYLVLICPSFPRIKLVWAFLIEQKKNERILMYVKCKHSFQTFNHNVPVSRWATLFW